MYKKINPDMNFVSREKEILDFWKKNRIFEKTLEKTKDGEEFSFYDGPPLPTASLISGIFLRG